MTVAKNVAFGLDVKKRKDRPDKAAIGRCVEHLLGLVELDELGGRYPSQLSGGQRQRVALARALAVEPRVLLLDEPFGSLDARVRQELRRWLRRLHDEIRVTSVFVTHDQEEALEVADRVVVMNQGRIEQIGTPQQVFDQPATPFVMNFLGNVNIFHGRVESGRALLGGLAVDYPDHPDEQARPAAGYARAHELEVATSDDEGGGLWATLSHVNAAAALVKLELAAADGRPIHVDLSRDRYDALRPEPGQRLYVRPRRLRVFVEEETTLARGATP